MLNTRREAEYSDIDAKNTELCDWIATKVLHTLLEELPSIIGRITDRLIVKFEERTIVIQTMDEIVEANQERDLGLETENGKRKRIHDSTQPTMDKEFNVFTYHMFKCYKCGEKEHVNHNSKKGQMCFHFQ